MTADSPTDFPYEAAPKKRDADTLRKYWGIAKGLQKVDGLAPSKYYEQLIIENIDGSRTLEETGELIRSYYKGGEGHDLASTKEADFDRTNEEADLVTQRIAELLAQNAFMFAPEMLQRIHAYLFQDLDPETYKPGQYKRDPLLKREAILNGDSVSYTDPSLVEASLRIAFEDELTHEYGIELDNEALCDVAKFVSRIWQVHPFVEGNTRTMAVFTVLYMNDLGYDITNEPFEDHARYFRDSLVRANYRNPKAAAFPDRSFLVEFLDAVLNGTDLKFDSETLQIQTLFDDPSLLRNMPSL